MLSYPRRRIINDKNYIFLFLTYFSVKDKSFLSPGMAKFRPRRWWVLVSLVSSFALFRVRGADGDASIHLFTLSLLWKWLWLSVIMALNALKLFNRRSQGLHSRCGLNSFPGSPMSSSIHRLSRCEQFVIWLLEEIFTILKVLNWTTQPTATLISVIRWWISFFRRLQNITVGHCCRTTYRGSTWNWVYFGDNIFRTHVGSVWTKLILGRPSLQWFSCHLPDSGRRVTRPNQGLSSLAWAGRWETLGTRLSFRKHRQPKIWYWKGFSH